jgi:hypothetical protein
MDGLSYLENQCKFQFENGASCVSPAFQATTDAFKHERARSLFGFVTAVISLVDAPEVPPGRHSWNV